jgi:hypothetical protein
MDHGATRGGNSNRATSAELPTPGEAVSAAAEFVIRDERLSWIC